MRPYLLRVAIVALIASASLELSFAACQYRVWPVVSEVQVAAGRSTSGALQVRNNDPKNPLLLKFRAVDMWQDTTGAPRVADPAKGEAPRPAAAWVTVSPTEARVPPNGEATVSYTVKAPPGSRGFYPVGLMFDPQEPEDRKPEGRMGVTVLVRIVAALRINVRGGTPRESAEVLSGELVGRDSGEAKGTTRVVARVANRGETRLDLAPRATVFAEVKGVRRRVWQGTSGPQLLYPGSQVDFEFDLGRRLPGGKYTLRVDAVGAGRTLHGKEFEVSLAGPAEGDVFAGELPVTITPPVIRVDIKGGALRTALATIANDGDTPVTVNLAVEEPPQLATLRVRQMITREYSCHPWAKIVPERLTVRPGGSAKAQVQVEMPPGADGSYYAALVADCESPSLGVRSRVESLIWAVTPGTCTYAAQVGLPSLADEGRGRYALSAPVTNTGTAHITPEVRAEVLDSGGAVKLALPLTSRDPYILRDATLVFSGSETFEKLSSGSYLLRVVARPTKDGAPVIREVPLEVKWLDGVQTVSLVEPTAEPVAAADTEVPADG